MNKYLFIFQHDNGYNCSCHREEWETHDTMEFASDAEMEQYVEKYNKDMKPQERNTRIIEAYKLAPDSPIWQG